MIEQLIESPNNSIIKNLKALKTKKTREKQNQYIVDGFRIVKHALDNKEKVDFIVISSEFKKSQQYTEISAVLNNIKVYIVDIKLMKLFVETDSPQGIVAVINKKTNVSDDLKSILILDRIQDPGNIGTLIRTADAAGFSTVVLVKGCTDAFSQKALRSSMGSIMNLNIITSNDILNDVSKLQEDDYKIYGAALEGGVSFRTIDFPIKKALIIGNEANGISKELLDVCDKKVYIPMIGEVESLNASIAGGVIMFEMNK